MLSVLSQMPYFVSHSMTQILSVPPWLLVLFLSISANKGTISLGGIRRFLQMAIAFFVFWGIMSLINSAYSRSSLPYAIAIAMFMLIIGNQLGHAIDANTIKSMFNGYIVASLILGVSIYLKYFMGVSNASRIFLYNEKNSAALILVTALVFVIFTGLDKKKKFKILSYMAIVFFAALVIIMKSRGTYVSLCIVVVILIFNGNASRRLKILLSIVVLALLIYFLTHEQQFQYILDKYIFAGRNSSDLNDISSGRVVEWENFWIDMSGGWILGHGRMKRETLILTALLEFGFPVGCLIISIAYTPILKGRYFIKLRTNNALIFLTISLSYCANMFFEQLAPFGPGVKCFMLWLLLGIYSSNSQLLYTFDKIERYTH